MGTTREWGAGWLGEKAAMRGMSVARLRGLYRAARAAAMAKGAWGSTERFDKEMVRRAEEALSYGLDCSLTRPEALTAAAMRAVVTAWTEARWGKASDESIAWGEFMNDYRYNDERPGWAKATELLRAA